MTGNNGPVTVAVAGSGYFYNYGSMAVDSNGVMFFFSSNSYRIQKYIIGSASESTLAGSGSANSFDGVGASASFGSLNGIAADFFGSVFVTESFNGGCRVRQIAVTTGNVQTMAGSNVCGFADGVGPLAMFNNPQGIAADQSGNIFVADMQNCRIRQISVSTRLVSTLAGRDCGGVFNGVGTAAGFNWPSLVVADSQGNLFVTENNICLIRKIVILSQVVSTFAGSSGCHSSSDGFGTNALFRSISNFAADSFGSLFVNEYDFGMMSNRIRHISIATAKATTISYATSGSASFQSRASIAAVFGSLYIRDSTSLTKFQPTNPCTAGFYCPANGTAPRIACEPGFYCPQGSSSAVGGGECPAGSFCPAGSQFPSPCSAGLYCPNSSMSAENRSYSCTGGYFCNAMGMSAEIRSGSCESGWYCPAGSSAPVPCSAGLYCPNSSMSAENRLYSCTGGYFCNATRASTEIRAGRCESGSFCPAGSSAPVPCTAGAFCSESGLSAPSGNCTGGVYCPISSSNQTGLCPAGLYCPASSPALACTPGYYCSAVGASAEARDGPCAIGAFCPAGSSSATQRPCTAGSFCNATGLSAAAGSCLAGYWCGAGSNSSTQNECAAGSYCVAGSSGPVLCPAGAYCAYAARGAFEWCPSGTFCRSAGLTAPLNLTCGEGCVEGSFFLISCVVYLFTA
jgi:hypothetical protein